MNLKYKVMAKFKVIEKSRFLDMNQLTVVKGGENCTGGAVLYLCANSSYSFCEPSVTGGFFSGPCPDGNSHYATCGGPGYKYAFCPGILLPYTTLCTGKVFVL